MPKRSDFERYIDPTGELTNKHLKIGELYVTHKILLRKVLIGLLGTWTLITVSIGIVVASEYLFSGLWNDRDARIEQTRLFSDYSRMRAAYTAQELTFGNVRVLPSAPGRYDFVMPVQNQNERYIAEVIYHYTYSGGRTSTSSMVVMPGQNQLLPELGVESLSRPGSVEFRVDDINWRRISTRAVRDVREFIDQRLAFVTENTDVQPAAGDAPARVTFDLINDTVYSYWSADFFIELKNGGRLLGVVPLSVSELRAGETREVDVRPLMSLLDVTSISLTPRMNIFDPDLYIQIGR